MREILNRRENMKRSNIRQILNQKENKKRRKYDENPEPKKENCQKM